MVNQACLQRCQSDFVGEASLMSSRYHGDFRTTFGTQVTKVPIPALRQALKSDAAFAEHGPPCSAGKCGNCGFKTSGCSG